LVCLGAARMELEDELSQADRFALAEGVRFALGRPTVGQRNFAADRMLHSAIMRVVVSVDEEIAADIESFMFAGESPCEIRGLVLDAVGRDEEGDTLCLATVESVDWVHALLGLAEDIAGRDWEMAEDAKRLDPQRRSEVEGMFGLPDGYFEIVEPREPQMAGAERFLTGLRANGREGECPT